MCNSRLALVVAFGILLVVSGGDQKAAPRVLAVELSGMGYTPSEVLVAAGETVVWRRRDSVPHTVTGEARQFDRGSVSPGAEWSLVARGRGRTSYTCTWHPVMKGAIVVQ